MSAETANTTAEVGHEHEAERPSYDDINTGVVVMIGIISTIVTIVTIAFVQGMTYHWESKLQEETSYDVVNTPAKVEMDKQKAKLEYDPATGAISIDDAMKQVLQEIGQQGQTDDAAKSSDETSTNNQSTF